MSILVLKLRVIPNLSFLEDFTLKEINFFFSLSLQF